MSFLGVSLRLVARNVALSVRKGQQPKLTAVVLRSFSSETKPTEEVKLPPAEAPVASSEDASGEGEILLYKESQHKTILMMLGVSGVNFMYWGSQLVHYAMYKDMVVQGINISGDPMWGTFGAFATGFFLYFARTFAHHSIFQCYETADHKRIGFQMHTMFGKPGRKFEVSVGNARFISRNNPMVRTPEEEEEMKSKGAVFSKILSTSLVPVVVQGFKGNALFDAEGKFYDKDRLVSLLMEPQAVKKAEPKDSRLEWKKQALKNNRKKKE